MKKFLATDYFNKSCKLDDILILCGDKLDVKYYNLNNKTDFICVVNKVGICEAVAFYNRGETICRICDNHLVVVGMDSIYNIIDNLFTEKYFKEYFEKKAFLPSVQAVFDMNKVFKAICPANYVVTINFYDGDFDVEDEDLRKKIIKMVNEYYSNGIPSYCSFTIEKK